MPKHLFTELRMDMRQAFRRFRHEPLAAGAAIVLLAVGIGSYTALVAYVQAVITRPASGVSASVHATRIRGTQLLQGRGMEQFPRPLLPEEVRAHLNQPGTFAHVAPWAELRVTIATNDSEPVRIATAQFTTTELFPLLGVTPLLGRALQAGDERSADAGVVLSDQVWRSLLHADSGAIGARLLVNGRHVRVAGVAPPEFTGPVAGQENDLLWLPLARLAEFVPPGGDTLPRLEAVAILAAGVTVEQATKDVARVAGRVLATTPLPLGIQSRSADVVPLRGSTSLPRSAAPDAFYIKYGSALATLVLVLVCVNLSALQVGRARSRRAEVAIRISLGASRGRIIQQFLTESIVLSVIGGFLGLVGWTLLRPALRSMAPGLQIDADLATIVVTLSLAVLTGVLFGLAPALYATRMSPAAVMQDSGGATPRRSRLQEAFIVTQICIAVPVLVAIMLVVRQGVLREDVSDLSEQAQRETVEIRLNWGAVTNDWRTVADGVASFATKLAGMPGITGVAAIGSSRGEVRVQEGGDAVMLRWRSSSPGQVALMGAPVVQGRDLAWTDTIGLLEPVLLSAAAAKRLFGSGTVIGQTIRFDHDIMRGHSAAVVIGILPAGLRDLNGEPFDLTALERGRTAWGSYLVRTAGPPERLIPFLESGLRAVSPELGVTIHTIREAQESSRAEGFWTGAFASGLGSLALLLSIVGIYAVTKVAIADRRREIGIRLAIGAPGSAVVAQLASGALRLAIRGVAIGAMFTVATVALFTHSDVIWPVTLVALAVVAAGVIVLSAISCVLPAVIAVASDPMKVLR